MDQVWKKVKLHITATMFLVVHDLIPFGGSVKISSSNDVVEINIKGRATTKGEDVVNKINTRDIGEVTSANAHIDYLLKISNSLSAKLIQDGQNGEVLITIA